MTQTIRVVAAVIAKDDRYLVTQRRPTAVLPSHLERMCAVTGSGSSGGRLGAISVLFHRLALAPADSFEDTRGVVECHRRRQLQAGSFLKPLAELDGH